MLIGSRRSALLLSSALVGLAMLGLGGSAQAADQTYQFDIPAESLGQALTDFSRASSQQIVFSEDATNGRATKGLHGRYTAAQALAVLLAGTDLQVETNSAGVMMVRSKNSGAASNEGAGNPNTAVETVTVTGTHLRNVEPLSPLITLTNQDLQTQGYTRLDDALNALPMASKIGVTPASNPTSGFGEGASYNAGFASGVNLRGLGQGATLVLLNGHPLPGSSYGFTTDISGIPVSAIDRAEILPDGASATYGADAVAGVVNIITRTDYDGFEAGARITSVADGKAPNFGGYLLGGYDWGSGDLVLNYDHEKDNPLYATSRSFTATAVAPENLLPSSDSSSIFGAVRQSITSDLTLSADVVFSDKHIFTNQAYAAYSYRYGDSGSNLVADASLDYALPADWHISLSGQFARGRDNDSDLFGGILYHDVFRNEQWSGEFRADGDLFALASGDVKLAVGGVLTGASNLAALSVITSYARETQSAYGELFLPILGNGSTILGLKSFNIDVAGRYDHYSDFGGTFNPKYSAVLEVNDGLSLHGSYGSSFRAPPLYLLNPNARNYAYILPTPNPNSPTGESLTLGLDTAGPYLRPERANSFEFGTTYKPEDVPGLKLDLSYFDISYKDKIVLIDQEGFLYNVIEDAAQLGPLVNLHPTQAQINAALNAPGRQVYNYTTGPWTPSELTAIAQLGFQNAATSHPKGLDAAVRYDLNVDTGHFYASGAISYFLSYETRITPQATPYTSLDTPYRPVRLRAKMDFGWDLDEWAAHGRINYVGGYHNPSDTSCAGIQGCAVSEYVTFDAGISYNLAADDAHSLSSGVRLSLDVINLFNESPPYVYGNGTGQNFDPINADPLGRAFSFTLSKKF
ncbi:MAG: TonB-dependent receptor [Rhizomicrobium sp.]